MAGSSNTPFKLQTLPAMSTLTTPPSISTPLKLATWTPKRREKPWVEPRAASQVAKKACALMPGRGKSWPAYPSRTSAPPPGLTFKELCNNFPNHLQGELLVEMSDAGLSPRDIVNMMPADISYDGLWYTMGTRLTKLKLARNNSEGAHSQGSTGTTKELSPRPRKPATPATQPKGVRQTPSSSTEPHPYLSLALPSTPRLDEVSTSSFTTSVTKSAQARRTDSSWEIPLSERQTQGPWQAPATVMGDSCPANWSTSARHAVPPTHLGHTTTTGTMITAENQFSFQKSPPCTGSASQYDDQSRYMESLRQEIRKNLTLLVNISHADETFISRSQEEQENDILLQWKRWCDGRSFALAKQYGVFIALTLTGRVIDDSLKRLLGTLSMIYTEQNRSGRATVEESDRHQALEYAEALCKQYTWDLQARAEQLAPASAPVLTPPARQTSSPASTPVLTPPARQTSPLASAPVLTPPARPAPPPAPEMTDDTDPPSDRYGFYAVRLSREALNLSQQSMKILATDADIGELLLKEFVGQE